MAPYLPREQAVEAIKKQKCMQESMMRLSLGHGSNNGPDKLEPLKPFVEFAGGLGPKTKADVSMIQAGKATPEEKKAGEQKILGDTAFKEGKYSEAATHYEAATKGDHPHNADCHNNRCLALLKLERWDDAFEAYEAGSFQYMMTHDSLSTDAPFMLKAQYRGGIAQKNRGCWESAEILLSRAAQIDPRNRAIQSELTAVKALLSENHARYHHSDDRRSELTARMNRYGSFGLTQDEIELLFLAGVMPWDNWADDYLAAARGGFGGSADYASGVDKLFENILDDSGSDSESPTESGKPSSPPSTRQSPPRKQHATPKKASPATKPYPAGSSKSKPKASGSTSTGQYPFFGSIEAGYRPATRQDLTQCQNCMASKSDGAKFMKCGKCLAAIYCSKQCQRKHWPSHKTLCAINTASREIAVSAGTGVDLTKELRGWTAKHRPTLSQGLIYAIDLHLDNTAHRHRVLFMIVEYQPQATHAAKKFKATLASPLSIEELLGMEGLRETMGGMPEQMRIMDSDMRKKGGLGTGSVVLLCSGGELELGVAVMVMPVNLGKEWEADVEVPPEGWLEAMMNMLNVE